MALHALAYCERLFYLEEVEEIRVADDRVFAGRALHQNLINQEDGEVRTFEMADEELGLIGKTDAIQHREGGWVPYEHKRGRPRRDGKGPPMAWPSDVLQVSAYGMLLESFHGQPVSEGRIRYHAENVTVRVPLDEAARHAVREAVARARSLRRSTERPPVTANERLCISCSLAPVCLPEEERLATDEDWEAIRLFPPHPDGQVLHVTTQGSKIGRSGDTLRVDIKDQPSQTFPIRNVQAVVLHGYVQMTTQAIHLCATENIAIHWLTGSGNYVAGLAAGPGTVQRQIRQFQALSQPEFRLELTRRLVLARAEGQIRYVLRATRGDERPQELQNLIADMRRELRAIAHADNPDAIRGHEGMVAKSYFAAVPTLLRSGVPDELLPTGRNRRPPRDRFNALLSFGYALLYKSVLQAILAVGLAPAFGFFHTPRSSAHPLVLDLMELFRVPVWDIAVIGSINRRQWDLHADFMVTRDKVWLSESGRRKAIQLFESRLDETWKHPVTDYSLSYARTIELEVRLLEKEWTGQPGLFARARLR